MRLMPLMSAAFVLSISGPSFGQEWIEFASRADSFSVNFPGEPKVRDIAYPTEYGITLPGHVYSYEDGQSRYSVTVVDYTNVDKIHAARVKGCVGYPDTCNNPSRNELRGALDYATWNFLQRDAKVTHYAYYNADLVEGRRLQLTNADRSRTFAAIHMHENRLYIFEGTVPASAPPPGLFQQSVGFLDKDGDRVRYQSVYSNAYPAPPRVNRPGQGQGQGR